MKIGTKSVLFGVHQFILHPLFVFRAWIWLFGWPSLGETVAIIIHDLGYVGKPNMDGDEGDTHPEWAALFFERRGRQDLANLCRGHSRFWAKKKGLPLSKLCYADKMGNAFMPIWLWTLGARLTGEIKDYEEAEKHEIRGNKMVEPDKDGRIDTYTWFRRYRYLVCQIIGEDLNKFGRSA